MELSKSAVYDQRVKRDCVARQTYLPRGLSRMGQSTDRTYKRGDFAI